MHGSSELTPELVQALPADPSDQLEVALRLASLAFSAKAGSLEAENAQLRQSLMQRQSQVKALERRVADLESDNGTLREEMSKLSSEKNALISTVKRLNRDIARLDSFKRSLLQSLQDEQGAEGLDLQQPPAYLAAAPASVAGSPPHAPDPGYGAYAAAPPSFHHQAPAPAYGGGAGAPSYSPGATATASSTPAAGARGAGGAAGSPRIDGKEFFRQARARLPFETFSEFLGNIKRLNQHSQTRQQTLDRARQLFGDENGDLYDAFDALLSRHMP